MKVQTPFTENILSQGSLSVIVIPFVATMLRVQIATSAFFFFFFFAGKGMGGREDVTLRIATFQATYIFSLQILYYLIWALDSVDQPSTSDLRNTAYEMQKS